MVVVLVVATLARLLEVSTSGLPAGSSAQWLNLSGPFGTNLRKSSARWLLAAESVGARLAVAAAAAAAPLTCVLCKSYDGVVVVVVVVVVVLLLCC